MLPGSRFWSALLAAGMLAVSMPALAAGEEDYEIGHRRFLEGDMLGAMVPLRKAVAVGHLKSMTLLAEILDYSEFDAEAVELYRKAAELGEPGAMFGLGVMISVGEGTKKDPVEGRRWIQKAAELGVEQAVSAMAQAYLKAGLGLTEADRKTPEALRWVQLAAKSNFLPAIDALAEAYRTGEGLDVAADAALASEYQAQANKIRGIDPTKGKKKKKKAEPSPAGKESVQ